MMDAPTLIRRNFISCELIETHHTTKMEWQASLSLIPPTLSATWQRRVTHLTAPESRDVDEGARGAFKSVLSWTIALSLDRARLASLQPILNAHQINASV